jgi:ribonuclease VapC
MGRSGLNLFLDASAIVAIIENESDRALLLDRVDAASKRLWSPMSCWEAVAAIQNTYLRAVPVARAAVSDFAALFALEMRAVGELESKIALDAYERYGKGRHRARLNMGDCFAYACAKTNDARLLYKGDDFTHTDMA